MITRKKNATTRTKKDLAELREEFLQAMNTNKPERATQLHAEIQALKNKGARDSQLNDEVKDLEYEIKRDKAIEKVNAFPTEVRAKHKAKAKQALKKIKKAKEDYIESLRVLNELNQDYYKATEPYKALRFKYNLIPDDITLKAYSDVMNNMIAPHPRTMEITDGMISKRVRRME